MANTNSVLIRSTKNYKTPSASNLAHNCGLKVATYWLLLFCFIIRIHKSIKEKLYAIRRSSWLFSNQSC